LRGRLGETFFETVNIDLLATKEGQGLKGEEERAPHMGWDLGANQRCPVDADAIEAPRGDSCTGVGVAPSCH